MRFIKDDVKVEYDTGAGKWFVANLNGKPVPWEAVYNVFVSAGGIANTTSPTPGNPGKRRKKSRAAARRVAPFST